MNFVTVQRLAWYRAGALTIAGKVGDQRTRTNHKFSRSRSLGRRASGGKAKPSRCNCARQQKPGEQELRKSTGTSTPFAEPSSSLRAACLFAGDKAGAGDDGADARCRPCRYYRSCAGLWVMAGSEAGAVATAWSGDFRALELKEEGFAQLEESLRMRRGSTRIRNNPPSAPIRLV